MKAKKLVLAVYAVCVVLVGGVRGGDLSDYVCYYDFEDTPTWHHPLDVSTNNYDLHFLAPGMGFDGTDPVVGTNNIYMDGVDDYAGGAFDSVNYMQKVKNATSNMTVSFWAKKVGGTSGADDSFLSIGYDYLTSASQYFFTRENINKIYLRVYDTNGAYTAVTFTGDSTTAGEWTHVVSTFSWDEGSSTGTATIYNTRITAASFEDGKKGSATISTPLRTPLDTGGLSTPARGFIIGRWPSGGLYVEGHMDELAIWDRTLSEQEIEALWEAGKSGLTVDEAELPPIGTTIVIQ